MSVMRNVSVFAVLWLIPLPVFGNDDTESAARSHYLTCLAQAHSTPSKAYENALIWKSEGGAAPARHCIAMALLGLGAYGEAAEKLEELSYAPDIGSAALRAQALVQSGEAWLQAQQPAKALRVLTLALEYEDDNAEVHTNRARALFALQKHGEARADLDSAIRLQPVNALAFRLRAAVSLVQGDLSAAQSDINAALALTPNDVETLLVRGQIREALRGQ